jgi:hypothetical protein|tara:strand:+ start:364 stop:519 length:156 start_codon:yes stop_codon:yes gene_type:complete
MLKTGIFVAGLLIVQLIVGNTLLTAEAEHARGSNWQAIRFFGHFNYPLLSA